MISHRRLCLLRCPVWGIACGTSPMYRPPLCFFQEPITFLNLSLSYPLSQHMYCKKRYNYQNIVLFYKSAFYYNPQQECHPKNIRISTPVILREKYNLSTLFHLIKLSFLTLYISRHMLNSPLPSPIDHAAIIHLNIIFDTSTIYLSF